MKYADRRNIDVSKYVEKKSNLSYLSWAWAVDQLLLADESATWEYKTIGEGVPYVRIGETAMVFCTVTAFGTARTAQLPVMDHRNKPIPNPDAFQVNTAMQRCLAKAIALHGIGLYIYNGEDLPPDASETRQDGPQQPAVAPERERVVRSTADACIALHAKALVLLERDNDNSGFWSLYEAGAAITDQEERLLLWHYLRDHSAVRSSLKEYAGYVAAQAKAKVAA